MANAWNAKLFPPATWVMVKEKRKLSLQLATCFASLFVNPLSVSFALSLSLSVSAALTRIEGV